MRLNQLWGKKGRHFFQDKKKNFLTEYFCLQTIDTFISLAPCMGKETQTPNIFPPELFDLIPSHLFCTFSHSLFPFWQVPPPIPNDKFSCPLH